MLPTHQLSALVDQLVEASTQALEQPKSLPLSQPLPSEWLCLQAGERHPLWVTLARHLFSGHWPKDQQRVVLRCAMDIWQGYRPGGFFGTNVSGGIAPEQVLLLAANANGWEETSLILEPTGLQDRLLSAALRYRAHDRAETTELQEPPDPYGPQSLETLDLTQMLVYGDGHRLRSRLMALRLRTFKGDPNDAHNETGKLIPDVGACLLGLDDDFQRGREDVQALINAVLKSRAPHREAPPAIVWSLHLLPSTGDSVQQVDQLKGASATAALAYGALYLLRHHLNMALPHVAALVEDLLNIDDPSSVTVTARFKPCADPALTWAQLWPELDIIGGASDKLKGLDSQLPTGRQVPHRFLAQGQSEHDGVDLTIFGAREADDLGDLLRQIAQQTSQLDTDERLLQTALLTLDDQQVPTDAPTVKAMERLASRGAPGAGVRKHLLWRYAQLCSGQPRPFGNVAQIGQHFVSLTVEGPRGHGVDLIDDEKGNATQSLKRSDLFSIFYPKEDSEDHQRWRSVPAWVILAPPFSGKTTLLNIWELTCIRAALKRQRDTGQWGEVPVFLPMNAFARSHPTAEAAAAPSAEQLGHALTAYARQEAPALPWSELLPAERPTQQRLFTPRRDGLRLRLCIDALNEYRNGQANESDAITRLCEWLAPRCHPQALGALLPPVFSVRREEKGNFTLEALKGRWVAHEISVQAWDPSQMRAYVRQRRLPADTEAKLLAALGLPGAEATDEELISADQKGPANPLANMCTIPGFLSAHCTLLAHWPHLQPSERRAEVMLALAWYSLDRWRGSAAFEALQTRAHSDPALAKLRDWLLPPSAQDALKAIQNPTTSPPAMRWAPGQAGGLIEGLTQVALALQEARGGAREAAPWRDLGATSSLAQAVEQLLPQPMRSAAPCTHANEWLEQSKASGLAIVKSQQLDEDGWPQAWLSFSHQQIQEFFSALSVTPGNLPDLTPEPFKVATEDLDDYLRQEGSKLELPAVTPHTERLRYAADVATKAGAEELIAAVLNQGNLALAAQLAIDQRARLEPPSDTSGRVVSHGFWFPERRHILLQHIRARLLLSSVDTGASSLPKLHASGILAGIADAVQGLPEPWRSQWAPLLPAIRDPNAVTPAQEPAPGWPAPLTIGVDLRHRLYYGLLLGELGDNIRYERVSAEVEGLERTGIRLKAAHWALIPSSGPRVLHRIGSDRKEDKGHDNHPAWPLLDGELPDTLFAHTPAVVMQWQAFWEDPLAQGKPRGQHQILSDTRFTNPLMPIIAINWWVAQSFTAWAAPLHKALADRLPKAARGTHQPELGLPTEVQHEAAVRFNPTQPWPTLHGWWPHDTADRSDPGGWSQPSDLPPTLFNHHYTRWYHLAPVGVFSAALAPTGIESMGNVWTWCSNLYSGYFSRVDNFRLAIRAETVERVQATRSPMLALRGSLFNASAHLALAACRHRNQPGTVSVIGLRWQLSRRISDP